MEKNNKRNEVWRSFGVGDVLDGYQSSFMISKHTTEPSISTQTSRISEPIMIPQRQIRGRMAPMRQQSAPVNVPDWSMIHGKKTKKSYDDNGDDDDDDDDDDEHVSSKEYFLGRSRTSSSSVMEGVGRKLKGRDLNKVRNAILKQTGFLE